MNSNTWAGVFIKNSSHNRIETNTITQSEYAIILLESADNNTIEENRVKNNHVGIVLAESSYNKIETNKVTHNDYGIALVDFSEHNKVERNKALANKEFDLYWDMTGNGNTWKKNRYKTKNW